MLVSFSFVTFLLETQKKSKDSLCQCHQTGKETLGNHLYKHLRHKTSQSDENDKVFIYLHEQSPLPIVVTGSTFVVDKLENLRQGFSGEKQEQRLKD